MRLSESISKNILETKSGSIINKFGIKKRRNVLFFEDILAEYIKECEKAGYGEEIENIGEKWMHLLAKSLIPKFLMNMIFGPLFNSIARRIWVNIGVVDDLHVTKKDNFVNIITKNEFITRTVGENSFSVGVYKGIVGGLLNSKTKCLNKIQNKQNCEYKFEIVSTKIEVQRKSKNLYNKLNTLPSIKGYTLKDALKINIFQLNERGHISFRGRSILNGENTLFHLIGNNGILLDKVPLISYNYFKEIIKNSSDIEKINLLKNLLQVMGWGFMNILIKDKNKILIKLSNLPSGFQTEKDNYNFLISVILGYLWLLDKKFRIEKSEETYNGIRVIYSK